MNFFCEDSIDNSKLEDRLSFDFRNFIRNVTNDLEKHILTQWIK